MVISNYYLPLGLTDGSPNPDLALVVHKINNTISTAHQGRVITLRMAYNNG